MSLKCINGILYVYDNRVVISRKTAMGVIMQGIKGDRTVFYADMASLEYKKPSMLANGYLKFILPGTHETNAALSIEGYTQKISMEDPNTLILRSFNKKVLIESEKIHTYILQKIGEAKNPVSASPAAGPVVSAADEITKFKKLLDDGVISAEEFEQKKKQLLGL